MRTWWLGEFVLAIAAILFLVPGGAVAKKSAVNPSAATAISEVRPEFISFGIDASQLTERNSGQPFDFTRPALRNLAAELAPAFIRYSGTKVESTFYDDTNTLGANDAPAEYEDPAGNAFVMSRDEWEAALQFADDAGLDVIASTSAGPGPRNPDGTWNPDNARALIERAIDAGHPPEVLMFGNEPNITYYGSGLPGLDQPDPYTAADYARDLDDFLELKQELLPGATFVGPGPFFTTGAERPLFGGALGPDVKDIMALTGDRYDVVSYHQYPAFGDLPKCEFLTPKLPADTLVPSFLDIPRGAHDYMASLRDQHSPGKPLWIDESGNTACGGAAGYSDKFISTFYYLNSLGYLAQQGVEVVTRWTFSGPQPYALVDDATLKPKPDYWAAVLWRRLMGPTVLQPAVTGADPELRVYSQCLPGTVGGTTTLVLNTSRTEAGTVSFEGAGSDGAEQYVVTGALDGDEISLNGVPLEAAPDGALPAMDGVPVQGGSVNVPPASYAFVTVAGAGSEACGSPPPPEVAPKVMLTAPRQSLRKILRTGRIKAFCRTDIPSTCRVRASIPKGQARRLGLKTGKGTRMFPAGSASRRFIRLAPLPMMVKLNRRLQKKLKKAPARFRPRFRLDAVAAGPGINRPGRDSLVIRLRR